jgi:hypothetical protein
VLLELAQERAFVPECGKGSPGATVYEKVQLPDVGFYLLPGMSADPLKEDVNLFLPVPLEPALGRTSLPMPAVDEAGAGLAGEQTLPLPDTDGKGTEAYQYQGNREIVLQ